MSYVSLFCDDHGFIATDQRVFTPDEMSSVKSALEHAILLEKRLSTYTEAVTQAADEARQVGYSEGLKQGRAEAALTLVSTLKQLNDNYSLAIQRTRVSGAELAVEIVRKIAGDGDQAAWVLAQAEQVARELVDEPVVKLRVNPDQLIHVKEKLQNSKFNKLKMVVSDELLSPSDCVLETALGQIDVSLDTQLDSIIAMFEPDSIAQSDLHD